MFVHETHNFFIMATMTKGENPPAGFLERKESYFSKALANIGAERAEAQKDVWMLKEVMYASAEDVYDIVSNEMMRIVAADNSISTGEKKLYELNPDLDKILVAEYDPENSYAQ